MTRTLPLGPEGAAELERCIAGGGLALFPADTVYGLAVHPESESAVDRLYRLKGRPPARPSAVMFFDVQRALAVLPGLGPGIRAAAERLLPGPITLVLPNPARAFPLACGPAPDRLGLRVPQIDALASLSICLLQSSANRSGGPDVRALEDVDPVIRAGVDLVLDGGSLPGTSSTVIDVTRYEEDAVFEVLREGAMPVEAVRSLLAR